MTGQVKEEILARWIELGVRVRNGALELDPRRVHSRNFLREPRAFGFLDIDGIEQTIDLQPGELAFTYCGVPVVYTPANDPAILVEHAGGRIEKKTGTIMSAALSALLFSRAGSIRRVIVQFGPV
jgi:hypothetical protein